MTPRHDVEADEVGELERTHRVVEADPGAGVDVLGGPDTLLEGAHRLGQERHEDAVDDEPRPVGRHDDLLAELRRQVADRLPRSSSVVSADRISSTSGMTGTGLKKCMPTNRCRRSPATASASRRIAIELVFDGEDRVAGAQRDRARATARS